MLTECLAQLSQGTWKPFDMNDLTACTAMRAATIALILLCTLQGSVKDFSTLMDGAEVRAMLQATLLEPSTNISRHDPDFTAGPCRPTTQTGRVDCTFHDQPVGVTDDAPPLLLKLTRNSRGEWTCTMQAPDLRAPDACHVLP